MFALVLAAAAAALAPAPARGDPVSIADDAASARGDRAEVLVLGSGHLSSLPKDFDLARFDPLLDRLAAWKPEAIAVEALSGAQCEYLASRAFAFPDTAKTYCPDAAPARTALALSGAQAEEEIETTLAAPSADRPAPVRRRLAALFLAAGDPSSAVVQWLRLPADERHAGDGLTDELVANLVKRAGGRNENVVIAARLAARLGHERVWPVDDHTGDRASGPSDEVFDKEMAAIWANPVIAERMPMEQKIAEQLASGEFSVSEWYQLMNTDDYARMAVAGDFAAAAASKLPGNTGRKYLAYWETRNLRMAANIREVVGAGRRTLAIVGAAHVPYYRRYLGMTSDIVLPSTLTVLTD